MVCIPPSLTACRGQREAVAPTKSRPLGGWDCGLKQEQHLSWYNDDVQAVKKEGKVLLYGTKFSTFKMGMQVPHRVQSEVSKKDHLQPITSGYTAVYSGFVQMEGCGDIGGAYDARPCASAVVDTAEILRLQLYGVLEREIGNDDL